MADPPLPPGYSYRTQPGPSSANPLGQRPIFVPDPPAPPPRTRDQAEKDKLEVIAARNAIIKQNRELGLNDDGTPRETIESNLTGKDYLATLPPKDARMAKAIAEGRLDIPKGKTGQISAEYSKWLQQAMQYDPELDQTNVFSRRATRRSFTSGPDANNITALNTALGHLESLAKAAEKLDNYQGLGLLNKPMNLARNVQMDLSNDPRLSNFIVKRDAAATELMRVFRQTGASTTEIQEWKDNISSAQSPTQLQDTIKAAADLLASRLDALNVKYKTGMGASSDAYELLSPHAKEIFSRYGQGFREKPDEDQKGPVLPGPGAAAPPPGGMPPGGAIPPSRPTGYNEDVLPTSTRTKTVLDPERSAYIDQLVRRGVPYKKALAEFRQEYPDGSSFAPKEYNQALVYNKRHPEYTGSFGYAERNEPVGQAEYARNVISQSPFGALGGTYANAFAGGIPAALAGDEGARALDVMHQQHPYLAGTGDVTGTIGGMVGTGYGMKAGAQALRGVPMAVRGAQALRGVPLAGRAANISPMMTGELAYGGIRGAAEHPDAPIAGAALGVGTMAAGNALGRYTVGPALRLAGETRPVVAGADWLSNRLGGSGYAPPPTLTPGETLIAKQARGSDFSNVAPTMEEAQRLNLPFSLADADPRLRMLAGSATRRSPEVRNLAETTLAPRQRGQAERALGAIDTHLTPAGDLAQIKEAAIQRARDAAKPHYDKAYATVVPQTPRIQGLLDTPAGRQALSRARTIAANEGRDPTTLGFALDASDNVILKPVQTNLFARQATAQAGLKDAENAYRSALRTQGVDKVAAREAVATARDELRAANKALGSRPMAGTAQTAPTYSTETLDYVKRGLDDIVEGYRDTTTGKLHLDEAGRAINGVRARLRNEVARLNPDYRKALKAYERFARQGTAAEQGYGATAPRVTRETVATRLGTLAPEDQPFYRQGYASSMADTVENARLAGNPYDRVYGSPAQQAKIEQLFPGGGAQNFGRINDLEREMGKTAYETIGGSPTAARTAADEAFDMGSVPQAAFDIGVGAATGVPPVGLLKHGARLFGREGVNLGFGKRAQARAAEVGPILLNTDTRSALEQWNEFQARAAARRQYVDQTRALGGIVGGAGLLGYGGN